MPRVKIAVHATPRFIRDSTRRMCDQPIDRACDSRCRNARARLAFGQPQERFALAHELHTPLVIEATNLVVR